MEITKDKITEIFCIIDDFCQEYDKETYKSMRGCNGHDKVIDYNDQVIRVRGYLLFIPNRSLGFLCVVRQREIL